jgi:flagellar biosynthesis/type III secretory pathway protein FliH
MISQNRELRVQYEMRRKAERDALALTRDARAEGLREGRKEGLREGLDEGRKEGLKEGLKEGRKEGLDEGKRLGLDEGRRQGGLQAARNMLLGILGARGLAIPEAVRARIEAEQDLERLQEWGVRAARAENAEDIFAA